MKKHKYDDNLILLGDENDNICLMLYNYFDVLIHNKDIFDNFKEYSIFDDKEVYIININKRFNLKVTCECSGTKYFALYAGMFSYLSFLFSVSNNKITYVSEGSSLFIQEEGEENIQKAIKENLENLNKKENKNNMSIMDDLPFGKKPELNKDLNTALVNFMKAKQERLKEFHIKIEYFTEEDANCIMDWNKEDCQKVIKGLHDVYLHDAYVARKKFESSAICVFCVKNSYVDCMVGEKVNCSSCEYKQHHGKCGAGENTWAKLCEAVDIREVFNKAWFVEVYIKYIAPHVSNEKDYENAIDVCLKQLTIYNCFESIRSLLTEYRPLVALKEIIFDCSGVLYTQNIVTHFSHLQHFKNEEELKKALLNLDKEF